MNLQRLKINGTATDNIATVATTQTPFTVALPNNTTGIPVRVRVASSVSGSLQLQISATKVLSIGFSPNLPSEFMIPPGSFDSPVSTVPGFSYFASAVGSLTVMVDYR